MGHQLHVLPRVALLWVDPVDAGIGCDVAGTLREGQRHTAEGATAGLLFEEGGEVRRVDAVLDPPLARSQPGGSGDVAQVVTHATAVVACFLVSRTPPAEAGPALGTQALPFCLVKVVCGGGEDLLAVAARPKSVSSFSLHWVRLRSLHPPSRVGWMTLYTPPGTRANSATSAG